MGIFVAWDGFPQAMDTLWKQCYGGSSSDHPWAMIEANDGNYVVCGSLNSSNAGLGVTYGLSDAWIFKIDPQGNIIWQKKHGGTNHDAFTKIIQTADNGFVICGNSSSDDIDVTENQGHGDLWVVKLNETDFSQTVKKVIVTDMYGRNIHSSTGNTQSLLVENLAAGNYILQAFSGGKTHRSKFIKQ